MIKGEVGARKRQLADELRALLRLAESCATPVGKNVLEDACAVGVRYARSSLRVRRGRLEQLAPRALRSFELHLHDRLRSATAPSLTLYLEAARHAAQALGWGGNERANLRQVFAAFPVLPRLWLVLISDWRDAVTEFLRRLASDRRAIERTLCRRRSTGRVVDLRAGLSDPHCGGRTVIEVRFRFCSLIYKPRAGDGEQAWFDCLSWMNGRGFTPRFRTLRVLRRRDHCWMEHTTPTPCRSAAAVRRFYRRLGGMIALADRCGAVDCHRENLIAAGEHPFLVDAETLLQTARDESESLPRILRTGFLPLPVGAPGAEYRASALSIEPGSHAPAHGESRCDPADYEDELATGFRLAQSIFSGSAAAREAFARRLAKLEQFRWRRIFRPTVDLRRAV